VNEAAIRKGYRICILKVMVKRELKRTALKEVGSFRNANQKGK
jgi:hypothetical protein